MITTAMRFPPGVNEVEDDDLIVNGTFDSTVDGWSPSTANATLSFDNGTLRITRSGIGFVSAWQSVNVEIGSTYLVECDMTYKGVHPDALSYISVGTSTTATYDIGYSELFAVGHKSVSFTANVTPVYVHLCLNNYQDGYLNFDDVQITKL